MGPQVVVLRVSSFKCQAGTWPAQRGIWRQKWGGGFLWWLEPKRLGLYLALARGSRLPSSSPLASRVAFRVLSRDRTDQVESQLLLRESPGASAPVGPGADWEPESEQAERHGDTGSDSCGLMPPGAQPNFLFSGLKSFLSSETKAEKCLEKLSFLLIDQVPAKFTHEGWGGRHQRRDPVINIMVCSIWDPFET